METRQERYLKGVKLHWYKIKDPNWTSDHCTFCFEVFHEGFATEDNVHLICKDCYADHQPKFKWKVE